MRTTKSLQDQTNYLLKNLRLLVVLFLSLPLDHSRLLIMLSNGANSGQYGQTLSRSKDFCLNRGNQRGQYSNTLVTGSNPTIVKKNRESKKLLSVLTISASITETGKIANPKVQEKFEL